MPDGRLVWHGHWQGRRRRLYADRLAEEAMVNGSFEKNRNFPEALETIVFQQFIRFPKRNKDGTNGHSDDG